MAWTLVSSLISLRAEFNALAPNRDRASDGSIGDAAHSASVSDHNPAADGQVHAIDVDDDLRRAGWTMNRAVQIIVTRHRQGADDRLQNVIYNRRIWSRSWGWAARAYVGANDHKQHAHFGARYTTAQENDTRPWGLLEADDMPLTNTDADVILDRDVIPNPYGDGKTNPNITVKTALKAAALTDVRTRDMAAALNLLRAEVAALAGKDFTDEDAIIEGVLAGLDGDQLERVIRNGMSVEQRLDLAARLAS